MNREEILRQANRALQELEEDINTYHPLAWSIPWEAEAIGKMQEIIEFYEKRKSQWMGLLAGAGDIERKTLLELMRCADLEIEGAKSVLYMIQGEDSIAKERAA
ncbi:MAG: hypothetical protein JRF35_01845 [Deltaproteobacteria bacterium]|nr:hypothetical protein [Deltaproteobacteria bacterium]MBW2309804.1 hypothetical protein [Deltaproteobacteria bacterium]